MSQQPSYDELRQRLAQAEAALAALRQGKVDTLMGEAGPLLVQLKSAVEERTRVEAALRWSETQLQVILESTTDGILAVDDQGKLIKANRRFAELWRIPQSLLESRDDQALLAFVLDQLSEPDAFRKKVEALYGSDATVVDTLTFKDGRIFERHSGPMLMPGRVRGRVWSFRDITERRRAEEAQRQLMTAVEQAAEIVMITDASATIQYVNPAFERITGYTRQETIGQNPRMLQSGKQDAAFYRRMWAVLTAGNVWSGHFTNKRKDGTLYEEDATISPVRDGAGRIINYVGVKRDVTEQKKLEEKFLHAQRLENLGMLAAGIAHDLNNVLAPILFATPLLRPSVTAARDHRIIDTLERSAERGAALVKQILGFVRTTGDQFQTLQVKHVARDIVEIIEQTFPKNIQFEHRIPSDLWPVQGNATQLHQVLLNLCVNARDAMPQGGVLTLTAANRRLDAAEAENLPGARPGAWLVLEVSDTGTGIPPDMLESIWLPFFTTKGPGKGTGLGLSTVRAIVMRHDGFVELKSQVGRGSTFRIHLPAAESDGVPRQAMASPLAPPKGHGELILVADDEVAVRSLVEEILKRHGYRVLACADGLEAVEAFNAHPGEIPLLVTDVDMPRLGGVALARALLPARPDLRVVAISGLSLNESGRDDVAAIREIAHAFLTKPFPQEVLLHTLHRLLSPPE